MKKIVGIILLLIAGLGAFAIDRSTPAEATFSACGGKNFVLRESEIFAPELASVDELETYEHELTFVCYTPLLGASSCQEDCNGFTQHYQSTDSPVELEYGVTLKLRKDYLTVYTFEKNITVIVYPAPKLNFGVNPLSH